MELMLGNNIDLLKTLEDNSIDAIVTDPPYGLNFMGKKWDYDVPSVEVWKECLRVLKPGGHLLSFAGTRTHHRMVVNIEDAGFEIRDMIVWGYGCLSEDTEILTTEGWKLYHKNINNDTILCYDIDKDEFSFNKPLRSFIYENQYPAYNIQSDYTDQIVSRNHRVIVERNGRKIFKCAEELETKENIPFLESLYDLPETIYDFRSCTSITKHDLLKRVQGQKNKFEKKGETFNTIRKAKENNFDLFCMWKPFSNTHMPYKKIKNSHLFKKMQWILQRTSVENTCTQRSAELETGKRNTSQRTNDWRNESSMEGWCNISQAEGVIYKSENKICQMPGRIHINGEKGRICNGTQTISSKTNKETIIENRMCPSYQSRCDRQQIGKSNVIQYKCGTQKIRRTNATIREIEYNGNVWCVEVPTGAFVARRNGKIFITGNSGFPKNLDVGKAVDKLQGNDRKVVGKKKGQGNIPNDRGKWGLKSNTDVIVDKGDSEWEGWGTALKPALEPITLARKPLSEKTVAQNVLKWGTGAINIGKSRIPVDPEVDDMLRETTRVGRQKGSDWEKNSGFKNENNKFTGVPEEGRWPANFIHDGSEEVISQFPYSKSTGGSGNASMGALGKTKYGKYALDVKAKHIGGLGDSGSTSRFFYCAKVSAKERNEGLDDLEDKMVGMSNGAQIHGEGYDKGQGIGLNVVKVMKNHHPTVKPIKLMSYLCNLITPPNGIVLDPFMGSGSTGVAAIKEGFDFIGMEMDDQYFEIATKRIEHQTGKEEKKEEVKKDRKTLGLFF